ncbi:MAG TPA: ATP phosphoribosyltransferase regulatory subunit [Acidiferrobacter sp.]|nr:ATP phosphoribosyltransferase regulatory subunit [Acidiferrobacter sp.]
MRRDRWLLPEGVEEILPPAARHAEQVRRDLLDLLDSWGYEFVMPPLIEYLESLLTGVGGELDLRTFKLTDQLTGRLMGLRADITPQAARIDAHYLRRDTPVRLCYLGPVVRTRPDEFGGAREPLQIGAELFGHAGTRADTEVLQLMLALLARAGFQGLHVDIGHVGVYRALAREAQMGAAAEQELFEALRRRSHPEVAALLSAWKLGPQARRHLEALIDLHGDFEEFAMAETALKDAGADVQAALADIRTVWTSVSRFHKDVHWHFDLAELNGYGYYTGVVFAAFVPGYGQAIAQGGRYDEVGRAFGRARPAVGFGADLRVLLKLKDHLTKAAVGIFAPDEDDEALRAEISALRAAGERVIGALTNDANEAQQMGCDRELRQQNGRWTVVAR